MNIRKQLEVTAATIAVVSTCVLFSQPASAQYPGPGPNVILNDTFGTSTINAGGTPTATSADYDMTANKAAAASITSGDLNMSMPATSSGFMEAAAVFGAPVTLQTTGDYIDFILEFTDTANLTASATQNQLGIGLFDSGGVYPITTNMNSGATITLSGGVQNWQGYSSDMFTKGTSGSTQAKIVTRSAQASGLVGNQDLLFNDTAASTYDNPRGGTLINGGANVSVVLTNTSAYTEDFRITLTGAGQLTVTNTLYAGTGTGGTILYTYGGYSNSVPDTAFDSLAFGFLSKATLGQTQDVSMIEITDIPEPSTWMLLASGLAMVVGLVSRRRRS